MKKLALPLLLLAMSMPMFAQTTTYDSVSGSTLNPERISFVFGHAINGQPGAAELVVQCDFGRAELITDADTLEAMASQFFGVACYGNGFTALAVAATPLTVNLTMTGHDANGQPVSEPLTLTVNFAKWHKTGQYVYRWPIWSGNAEIVY